MKFPRMRKASEPSLEQRVNRSFCSSPKALFQIMLLVAKNWFNRKWSDLSLRNKGVVFLFLPIAALLFNSALIYHFAAQRGNAQSWVIHTFQVQLKLQEILSNLSAVVVDTRTYQLTKDRLTLDLARKEESAVLAAVYAVQLLTADNPRQQQLIPQLSDVIRHRLKYLLDRAVIDEPFAVPKEIENQAGQRTILRLIDHMAKEEATLMPARTGRLSQAGEFEIKTGVVTVLMGIVCGSLGIWLFLTGVSRRISAVGRQVALLAEGIQIQRIDQHSDEIGLVCAGLERTSALLVERETAVRSSNALVEQTADLGARRFQSLVNATAQIVWITDVNGQVYPGSRDLSGLADERFELFAHAGWREFIHPEDRAAVQTIWANALADRKAYECEFRLHTGDQSYREFHMRGMPVLDANGDVCEWIRTASDVSEAKRADGMRRQLAAIVESSDDAIFSITLDDVIASWNKGAERVFGYSADEVLGRNLRVLSAGGIDDMDLDRQCVETGLAIKNRDVRRQHKNGSLLTVALTLSPIRDAAGRVSGVSKIARDVTAHRLVEELLQQQANLLEQAYEPMIAWEPSGLIAYWNRGAQDLYGYSSEQAVGRNIHQLLRTRHPSSLVETEQQLATEHLWIGELEHIKSSGAPITVESRQKRLALANGRSLILESNHDITLRKEAEKAMRQMNELLEARVSERTRQLSEANAELEAFCYSVSHDLRAPLRSVEGIAKILVRDHGEVLNDTGLDLIRRMRAATVRMGQLIEDLLGLSKISRAEVHRQSVDLSKLAAAVVDDLSSRDTERRIEIELEPGLVAEADPRLLRVALENLFGNAWKFTGKNPSARITFGAAESGEYGLSYFVRDNGAGFDMAFANQLFAPFQRLHAASEFEGTGIGLATVQRIIHRHQGRIWADSRPGAGATFSFTLGNLSAPAIEQETPCPPGL
jgi:PAS domain S-box-containing protein